MTAALEGGEWSATRPGCTLPPGKTRYPFYRRLGGPQGRSGRAENLVPTGIRSRTVQAVAQSLYRLSYPAHHPQYGSKWNYEKDSWINNLLNTLINCLYTVPLALTFQNSILLTELTVFMLFSKLTATISLPNNHYHILVFVCDAVR